MNFGSHACQNRQKKIKTPMLSTANWGGQGLHPGVILRDISDLPWHKWLEAHGTGHIFTQIPEIDLQKRFLDISLKVRTQVG